MGAAPIGALAETETKMAGLKAAALIRPIYQTAPLSYFEISCYNEYNQSMVPGIQAEIKQAKPFGSLEEEALIAMLRTSDKLQQQVAEFLKPYGLSPTQFNALRILRGAGEAGLPCSEIGERMINHDPDITRLMDRLEQRGLVERARSQKDRRVHIARITSSGLDILKTLDRPMEQFHRRIMAQVGKIQLQSLIRVLAQVRVSLAR